VKTSGSTGLHVLVPLGRQVTYEQSRNIGYLLALMAVRELEGIATVARLPSQREGKVYVDFLQNGHGRLIVAPLCVRPLPGAPGVGSVGVGRGGRWVVDRGLHDQDGTGEDGGAGGSDA